jgi:diadenosine tetraphosphate (Ap4A) HIT family hydrolase
MDGFRIPEHLIILRTAHWALNHRVDSVLPGYLMLGARMPVDDLSLMPADALAELGTLLAKAQRALNAILAPQHLYIGRYGHAAGHAFHFHIIPVCGWVRQRFFGDPRYRVLRTLVPHASAAAAGDGADGAELTLYVWREFCENPVPPQISGPSVHDVVARLRAFMSTESAQGGLRPAQSCK